MSNLTAKFAAILLAGVAAGAVVVTLPVRAVHAADTCLTEPKGDAPHGKHWHYRIERGTGHHCWYLRGEDEKAADAPSAAPTQKVASQQPDAAASRSFADAHDEVAPRASTTSTAATDNANAAPSTAAPAAAPSVWPNPAAATAAPSDTAATTPAATPDASPSPVASRWPQASDTAPAATAPSDSTPVPSAAAANPPDETSAMVADAAPNNAAEAPSAPPPPADLVTAPAERQTGSLQTLLLVAFGALALAGLTGSAVYRLGRRSKRNNWLRERNAWQDAQNPHRPPWVDEPRIQPDLAVADLDQSHLDQPQLKGQDLDQPQEIEPQSGFSLAADETSLDETPPDENRPGSEHIEKIEEFLARLTQQLQDELEGTRPRSA